MAQEQQDQSMEEILQSIKRIIAEEGEAAPAGSDVLELTEMVRDDGSVTAPTPAEEAPRIESMSLEDIIAAPVAPEPPAAAPVAPPKPEPKPMSSDENLVSKEALAKSTAAMDALKNIPAPSVPMPPPSGVGFRSGTTIEALVLEGLKPMLKEWLDANLPGMVERLVEREIKKLSTR
jgi:cell pole-organizing protein PopZ